MAKKRCGFECENLEDGECLEQGGECIGDLCEEWKDCEACYKRNECENARV